MEIKKGDKVKVSKDAPKVYLSSMNNLFKYHVCKVEEVDGDSAIIRYTDIGIDRWLAIPIKYLVKVDAEAKEAKFKKGDRVRNIKSNECGIVHNLNNGVVEVGIPYVKPKRYWDTGIVELVSPTEQTEAEEDVRIRQMEAELDEFIKAELDRILHPEKYYTYEVTIDNVAMNWQRYEADLAKEVAVMLVRTHRNDLNKVAKMSVDIAKAVVEGLKRK